MELTKKELKKISRDFRIVASRTINAHYEEINNILKMFISFIDDSELISSYIRSIDVDKMNIENEVNEVLESYGRIIFDTGKCPDEEIVYTYRILKYLVEKKVDIISISMGYGDSNKYQDKVKGFGTRVILPFANYIESYLCDIFTDMGFDEEGNFMITVKGGQVNIAKDKATINANQYNNIDLTELNKLTGEIKGLLTEKISPQEREFIRDNVEAIEEELKKENPKRGLIKTAIKGLEDSLPRIVKSVELTGAITSIIQFAMAML